MTIKLVNWGFCRRVFYAAAFIPILLGLSGCDQRPKPSENASTNKNSENRTNFNICVRPVKLPDRSSKLFSNTVTQAELRLNNDSNIERLHAVDVLVQDGSEEAVEVLAAYIESLPLDAIREEVVRRASTISDTRAIPSIIELLYGAEDPSVFRMAQEIFIRVADAEAVQDVLDRYDGSTDVEFRNRLAKTIALTSSEAAVEPLRMVVLGEGQSANDGMVLAAASALAQIGTQPAVDTLLERLNAEQTEEGCSFIAAKLGEVRGSSAETTLQGAALGGGKFSTQTHTRVAAISALSNYPSVETQDLLASLASEPEPEVATAAKNILGQIQQRFINE